MGPLPFVAMVFDAYFGFAGALLLAVVAGMVFFRRYRRSTSQLYDDIDRIRLASVQQRKRDAALVLAVPPKAELPDIPAEEEPTSLPGFNVVTEEKVIAAPEREPEPTMGRSIGFGPQQSGPELLAESYNRDCTSLRNRHRVREFTIANMQAMGKDHSLAPEYRFVEPNEVGEYWLVDSDGGKGYAVPRPKPVYNIGQFKSGGLEGIFECRGFRQGCRYRIVEVVKPAMFRDTGSGCLELVEPGTLDFRAEEVEFDDIASVRRRMRDAVAVSAAVPEAVGKIAVQTYPEPADPIAAGNSESGPSWKREAADSSPHMMPERPETVGEPRPKAVPRSLQVPPKPAPSLRPAAPPVRQAELPNIPTGPEPTIVPGFSLVTEEEVTVAYNEWPQEFASRLHPVRAAPKTMKGQRTFVRDDDGDYWMIFRSTDIRYVVPYPGLELDDTACQELISAFRLIGHRPGYRYRKMKLVHPAIFSGHGLVRPGTLALEEGEPDVDLS